jgi:hypothetical protein
MKNEKIQVEVDKMERYPWWMQPAGTIEKVSILFLFFIVATLLAIILL